MSTQLTCRDCSRKYGMSEANWRCPECRPHFLKRERLRKARAKQTKVEREVTQAEAEVQKVEH